MNRDRVARDLAGLGDLLIWTGAAFILVDALTELPPSFIVTVTALTWITALWVSLVTIQPARRLVEVIAA